MKIIIIFIISIVICTSFFIFLKHRTSKTNIKKRKIAVCISGRVQQYKMNLEYLKNLII